MRQKISCGFNWWVALCFVLSFCLSFFGFTADNTIYGLKLSSFCRIFQFWVSLTQYGEKNHRLWSVVRIKMQNWLNFDEFGKVIDTNIQEKKIILQKVTIHYHSIIDMHSLLSEVEICEFTILPIEHRCLSALLRFLLTSSTCKLQL